MRDQNIWPIGVTWNLNVLNLEVNYYRVYRSQLNMSNFSIFYFKNFCVYQTIQQKTIEWLVINDFEGKWKERLVEKIWGIRGIRLEELRNAVLDSTQNIQQDVVNKKHGF
jgi:hypothetical protein